MNFSKFFKQHGDVGTMLAGLACVLTIGLASCSTPWIDPAINTNPNNPADASSALILSASEVALGYTIGGDISRYSGVTMQYFAGVGSQFTPYDSYVYDESVFSTVWNNLYVNSLLNFQQIIDKANASNTAPYYRGVARVLRAYTLGVATDAWGDIPATQALQGSTQFKPKYDTQESVYALIQATLDSAIADLSVATSPLRPTTDDVIFAGNKNKWLRTARTLKARHYIHLTKVNATAAAQALAALNSGGMSSNADNFGVKFGADVTANGPMSQFLDQRAGNIATGKQIITLMNALQDPRIPLYFAKDADDKYSVNSVSGDLFAAVDAFVPFVTYAESKFIEAEARLATGDGAGAKTAFSAAVAASFSSAGVAADASTEYVQKITPSGSLTLQTIIEQKYIALYTQMESWTDWRRTGFPAVISTTGVQTQIPRRFLYPQNERTTNAANIPANTTLTSRVWWDKQ
jgi:hypothetical protein